MKDLSHPMEKEYDPKRVEAAWYSWWEKERFFHGDEKKVIQKVKKPYMMVIPPPNVTGSLHLGHALMLAIEDTIIRW
jgi:valyl-tRNA synthetase